jgi:hypothetical protein
MEINAELLFQNGVDPQLLLWLGSLLLLRKV